MADINFSISSDAATAYVKTELRSRTIVADDSDPQNPVTATQYYALVTTRWAGRIAVTKEVQISELPAAQRAELLSAYNALHALALGKVTAEDFKR